MICSHCKKTEAALHLNRSFAGRDRTVHLCHECAHRLGLLASNRRIPPSASELLSPLVARESEQDFQACPNCGSTYLDIRQSGQVGCSECYSVFHSQLQDLVRRVSMRDYHRGKYPDRLQSFKRIFFEREDIRERLERAVENEDFEGAAQLRDELQNLEGDHENL